jgi:hypothetical protein
MPVAGSRLVIPAMSTKQEGGKKEGRKMKQDKSFQPL